VPLGRDAGRRRGAIGFVAPGEHLYDRLTARENLDFFAALYGVGGDGRAQPQTIEASLDRVGLGRWRDEYAGALSSGMKFRLSLAKWQLLDPSLLLVDEPYGVLDGAGIDLLESFLRAQSAKGTVVIIASHHVARVLELCSRALILDHGKIIFDELRRDPWDNFTAAFSAFMPASRP
jgi:ABC-type multidrug transport system ATPase subunit